MQDDIEARLRSLAGVAARPEMLTEAADTIASLRAEVERLREASPSFTCCDCGKGPFPIDQGAFICHPCSGAD